MGRVSQQYGTAIDPGGYRVPVNHRIFKNFIGTAQHGGHIQPAVVPVGKVANELIDMHASVPVAIAPTTFVVDGDFGNPVDGGQTGNGVCRRDGVKHHAVSRATQADERRIGARRHARRGAPPHDGTTPLNGRLLRMHLGAHGGMQPVGRD